MDRGGCQKTWKIKKVLKKIIAYLQLLQEPISRMSSTSAIYKGFSAAILAGFASASFSDISLWAMIIGMVPLIVFLALDIYYLQFERKLKYRYKQVVNDEYEQCFLINTKLSKNELSKAKAYWYQCLFSSSILLFYVPVIGCTVALIVLKIINVI